MRIGGSAGAGRPFGRAVGLTKATRRAIGLKIALKPGFFASASRRLILATWQLGVQRPVKPWRTGRFWIVLQPLQGRSQRHLLVIRRRNKASGRPDGLCGFAQSFIHAMCGGLPSRSSADRSLATLSKSPKSHTIVLMRADRISAPSRPNLAESGIRSRSGPFMQENVSSERGK